MRTVFIGGSQTGKTTAALEYPNVIHTDDFMFLNWSNQSKFLMGLFDIEDTWTLEGVSTVRCLRKWLKANPEGKPCDTVIYLDKPFNELIGGQKGLMTSITNMYNEIKDELIKRGVVING